VLNFAGLSKNSYDPASGAVPTTGYQNSSSNQDSSTITILGSGNDFGQLGLGDNDVTSFSNNGFTFKDNILAGTTGFNSSINLTFTDTTFGGVSLLSNNFPGLT
jgi:hypothetical protein